jgi:hypothetical protein
VRFWRRRTTALGPLLDFEVYAIATVIPPYIPSTD